MTRIHLNQRGIAAVEAVLLVVILAIVGGTGYYVYHANKKTDDTLSGAAKSSSTSPDAKKKAKQAEDETAKWLLYTVPGGSYTMRIPDGWVMEQNGNDAYAGLKSFTSLAIKPGTPAVINQKEAQGRDFISGFIFGRSDNPRQSVEFAGEQQASLHTKSGLEIKKYYLYQAEEPQGIGLEKGGKSYTYLIENHGISLVATYAVEPGQPNYYANVEKALTTITIK